MDSPVLASMTVPPGQSSSCGRTVIRGIRLEALDLPARERPLDGAVHAPARKGFGGAVDALDSRLDGAMIAAGERLAQRVELRAQRGRFFSGKQVGVLAQRAFSRLEHALAFDPLFRERARIDRKSTRLNSSHVEISYAVFCLKKKKTTKKQINEYNKKKPNIVKQ